MRNQDRSAPYKGGRAVSDPAQGKSTATIKGYSQREDIERRAMGLVGKMIETK